MIDRARFALEHVKDGGLLLDLRSGNLFRMNQTAAFVWGRALDGRQSEEIAQLLSEAFNIPEVIARRDVDTTLILPSNPAVSPAPTEFRYQEVGNDYRFLAGDVPLLFVQTKTQLVRAERDIDRSTAGICIRSITPKLVALLGWSILHGSAVVRPNGSAMLFLGESGAGKTTTAKTLCASAPGWRVLSEDKVVLRPSENGTAIAVRGEPRISSWISSASIALAAGKGATFALSSLATVGEGEVLPIAEVVLLDARRRTGFGLAFAPLGQAAAAQQIFSHGFYGSAMPAEWRRQVHMTAMLARTAMTYEGTLPAGLEALREAAARYTEITAS